MPINMDKYLKAKDKEEKRNKKVGNILIRLMIILLSIFAIIVIGCICLIIHFNNIGNDIGYAYGFVDINTNALREYCSMTDYVPEKYADLFKQRFSNTFNNANYMMYSYCNEQQINDLLKKQKKLAFDFIEKDYQTKKNENPNLTKTDFCKSFDKNPEKIINDKVNVFKKEKTKMFKD